MHRGHKVLILALFTAPSPILPYSEGKAKRGGTRVSPSRERETRLPPEPGLQLPLTLPTESHRQQNPLKGTKTMRAERGASLLRTRGGRLTQPAAGQRRLSGECLSPQPGVRPKLKKPSSLSQTPPAAPPTPTPGQEEGPPQPLGPHPAQGFAALSAYLFSLSTHSSDAKPCPLSHSLPLCLSLSLSPSYLSLSLSSLLVLFSAVASSGEK